jgi:hypothetical protein
MQVEDVDRAGGGDQGKNIDNHDEYSVGNDKGLTGAQDAGDNVLDAVKNDQEPEV